MPGVSGGNGRGLSARDFPGLWHQQYPELIAKRQCFAAEISSPDAEAIELKYWYGTFTQNGKTLPLKFGAGSGYVKTTESIYMAGGIANVATSKQYYYYADACLDQPIELAKEFSLRFEPRYKMELLPIDLTWLGPKL